MKSASQLKTLLTYRFLRAFWVLFNITATLSADSKQPYLIDETWLNENVSSTGETILYHYHPILVDKSNGILPWYSSNLGQSYNDALRRTWAWFKGREPETSPNIVGIKPYMFHQVWTEAHDMRGLGGDQIPQFLSSLDLLYNYTGDESVLREMFYQADYYLDHSLSPANSKWPHLPFPYNTENPDVHTGVYDGDMILGKDFTQPDKAGSFGWELVKLYMKSGNRRYLEAAAKIATTLAERIEEGDGDHSPLPFKVNAYTGKVGSAYTTNFTGILELFRSLCELETGDTKAFQVASQKLSKWLKSYPAKTNKWGPFFEDVPGWSDTQINALSYARYLMEHPDFDTDWVDTVEGIFGWAHRTLGNSEFERFGVEVINEQTSYPVPGQSHSARQAAAEILFWSNTGDHTRLRNSLRMLNWATYSINFDGANRYPRDAIWYSDGYGDFWRHILRAMSAAPQLAPDDENHLLESTSIVCHIKYQPNSISYDTFSGKSKETLRLVSKPVVVMAGDEPMYESDTTGESGWHWQSLPQGGIMQIEHHHEKKIAIQLSENAGVISIASPNQRIPEGNHGFTKLDLVVTRKGGTKGRISVRLRTADGTALLTDQDYEATDQELDWNDGDSAEKHVQITIKGDTNVEQDEYFWVEIAKMRGEAAIAGPCKARIEIVNDDVDSTNLSGAGSRGWVWHSSDRFSDQGKASMPAAKDGDLHTDFYFNNRFNQAPNTYEMAGITWPVPQYGINRIVWYHGNSFYDDYHPGRNGPFSSEFGIQSTKDGYNWVDHSDWITAPAFPYDSPNANEGVFEISGPAIAAVLGIRIIGKVHESNTGSWQASGREIQVFAEKLWSIHVAAGKHGKVLPNGASKVRNKGQQTFRFEAENGYRIANIIVDGVSKGAISEYTFIEVTADHALVVNFEPNAETRE